MRYETWTRIAVEGEDFHDVVEDYETVKSRIESSSGFIEFVSITNYGISIRKLSIQAFYESGIEIMKRNWEHSKELEDLKKSVIGWNNSE